MTTPTHNSIPPTETALAAAREIYRYSITMSRNEKAFAEIIHRHLSASLAKVEGELHKAEIGNQILKEMVLSQDDELTALRADLAAKGEDSATLDLLMAAINSENADERFKKLAQLTKENKSVTRSILDVARASGKGGKQ